MIAAIIILSVVVAALCMALVGLFVWVLAIEQRSNFAWTSFLDHIKNHSTYHSSDEDFSEMCKNNSPIDLLRKLRH